MFGPEVGGIPVFLIIIFLIWVVVSLQEQKEKAREAAKELWKGIASGMSKKQVVDKLGQPQEIIPGVPEIWVYEFNGLRGCVMFKNDVLIGFQAPR